MKLYETVFILDASPEAIDAEIQKVTDLIVANKGEVVNIDRWGMRKLAYEIKDKGQGFYTCVYFHGDKGLLGKLENHYKLNEACLRYLTVVSSHKPDEIPTRGERAETRPAGRAAREPRPASARAAAAAARPRGGKPEEASEGAQVTKEPAEEPEETPEEPEATEEPDSITEKTPSEAQPTSLEEEDTQKKAAPEELASEESQEGAAEEQEVQETDEEESSPSSEK